MNDHYQDAYPDIRVSVIIATRNRPVHFERVLTSLFEGTRCPDEVIICDQSDNNLTRDEVERVKKKLQTDKVHYFHSNKRGISRNRNDALRSTTGDFIASVDDDIVVDPKWLELMLKEWIEQWGKKSVVIVGRILPAPELSGDYPITAIKLDEERYVYQGRARYTNLFIGAHFGMPRKVLNTLGSAPFDELFGVGSTYPGGDDSDFGYQVTKAGFPIVYEPSIFVYHYTERITDWVNVNYKYALGNGANIAKYVLGGDFFAFYELFLMMKSAFGKLFKGIFKADKSEVLAMLLSLFAYCLGFIKFIMNNIFRKKISYAEK